MNIEQDMELEGGGRMTTRTRTIEDEHYWRHLERQYAGQAMQGLIASCADQTTDWPKAEVVARMSTQYARALIARLKGEEESNAR